MNLSLYRSLLKRTCKMKITKNIKWRCKNSFWTYTCVVLLNFLFLPKISVTSAYYSFSFVIRKHLFHLDLHTIIVAGTPHDQNPDNYVAAVPLNVSPQHRNNLNFLWNYPFRTSLRLGPRCFQHREYAHFCFVPARGLRLFILTTAREIPSKQS